MALDDRGKRRDRGLEAFALGDQPERGEDESVIDPSREGLRRPTVRLRDPCCELSGAACEDRRGAVRDDPHLLPVAHAAFDQQSASGLGHHDDDLGLFAKGSEDLRLVRGRRREHGVERHDERLRQLLRERHDVLAIAAAVDPELVLEEDDIDVEAAEYARRPHVVAADRLGDRGDETGALRTRGLVDDDDALDAIDGRKTEESSTDICGKGADSAGSRRIGRNDRGTHRVVPPSIRDPAGR